MMDDKFIFEKIHQKFGEQIIGFEENYDIMAVYADKEINLKLLQYLYDDPELGFKFLTDLTAIHYPDNKGEELVVTYLVYNMLKKKHLRLKFKLDIQKPDIYTATSLHAGANWLERECYDFFGVNFVGHPNLIRIMNVEEMDYFPLRKEYPLEDQTRKDKDDDMFGRGDSHFNLGKLNI
ncbi:MAG: NADH-quinone oxidoreductase subunit C [Weeksellaceae bacterium]|jgi:NADH-quinone oxidoreductase subunit C|nr:NADH-quinone oxidoreductase subunit C [Weeksellaceae bacterium]